MRQVRVYNLCDSYEYQTAGYYVSLLAAARGHRTMPGVATIQDVKSRSLLRADDELEEIVERSLHTIKSKRFELSIYFGCNVAERHADLSRALFNLFPMPLMRATFAKSSTTGLWRLRSITPIPVGEIPTSHGAFLRQVIENHFARRGPAGRAGPQRAVRARSRDPDRRQRALAAVEPRGAEALRAGRARERLRRRVLEPRRLRPHRRVRRAVHPHDDGRQPSHLSVREPGARRGARRHRRSRVDHPLRQQGLPGRARETARPRDPADDGRRQPHAAPTRSSASSACRAC